MGKGVVAMYKGAAPPLVCLKPLSKIKFRLFHGIKGNWLGAISKQSEDR